MVMTMALIFSLPLQLSLNSHNFELEINSCQQGTKANVRGVDFLQEKLGFGDRLPDVQEKLH